MSAILTTNDDTNIELTELALYSANGVRHNLNLALNGTNNVAGLNPGEFCPMGSYPTYPTRTEINLFDGKDTTQWTVNTATFIPATPVVLVMRLTNGTPPIAGFDLQYWSAAASRYLSGWTLEGSRDGIVWVNLHSATNYIPIPPAIVSGTKWWYSTGTVTPSNGFAIVSGEQPSAQLQPNIAVSVSAGATLTLLGGNEPLHTLTVDCDAGGGTINALTLATTGQINLTGSTLHGRSFAVPLTIGAFSNPAVLSAWTVTFNGQPALGVGLRWDAVTQTIRIYTMGTQIILN